MLANMTVTKQVAFGPVYTECKRQGCDVARDITQIKFLRFINKPSELLWKWVVTPIDQIYAASIDIDAPNQSLTFSVKQAFTIHFSSLYVKFYKAGGPLMQCYSVGQVLPYLISR